MIKLSCRTQAIVKRLIYIQNYRNAAGTENEAVGTVRLSLETAGFAKVEIIMLHRQGVKEKPESGA